MGSYIQSGYTHLSTGIAGERTGGTRHNTMQTAQSLEEQADMFLIVADATTDEESFTAAMLEADNGFPCAENVDIWTAAAGLYGTDEDEGELAWQTDALCAQTDPEAFFPEKGGSTRDAKRVCGSCPVREECLKYAMDNDERFGIWGGLSERERRRLRKQAS